MLVTGGRDFADADGLHRILTAIHRARGIATIIHGRARGADTLAERWAVENGIPTIRFAADWTGHGAYAGPIRNGRMLREGQPDYVLAFPGGRGTADCVRQARRLDVPVLVPHGDLESIGGAVCYGEGVGGLNTAHPTDRRGPPAPTGVRPPERQDLAQRATPSQEEPD